MNSWLAWIVTAAVAVTLGAVGYHFSLRALRWVALIIALATAAYLTVYGLTHPGQKPGSLSDEFARSADMLSTALIRPVSLGHTVPAPGQIGWLAIVVLLVLAYRALEVWALRRQAPCLDTSALTSDRQDTAADAATDTQAGKQRHDWLVAELKFRLPSVEVRSPAILPGGSRPSGLASIAEATGVNGAGLAGAIIRFFGMIWPSAPKIQVRAWVEQSPGPVSSAGATRVTVSLADPRSGASIATKTLAAGSLDDAAAAVAGYVARHIFARDRTVPPWSASATDGADLAALLRARQVRAYPECRSGIRDAWKRQIEILEAVAHGNLCAGVVRYELAQLYDLTGRHVEALLLHATNREQYPRFYRGRYRLAMSLEMLTNPDSGLAETDPATLKDVLRILDLCSPATVDANRAGGGQTGLPGGLEPRLLAAAWQELQEIERYLTWRHIIWGAFRHRNERSVLKPYRQPRHRQAFHDGVRVAQLLVAVRQAQLAGVEDLSRLHHAKTIARITAAISGDTKDFVEVWPKFPPRTVKNQQPVPVRQRTRLRPGQCSTPSWPAAYNLACAYAALAEKADAKGQPHLIEKVVGSLEFTVSNPECEMERPSEWIGNDPDFSRLSGGRNDRFMEFLDDQWKRDYPVGG
ncbi:MAG TPA: hypothetical protein VKU77_18145 [Streptosporangiaceae bacterium]|nr:hypothetical protein [Streptosporangiaceae bacterium]